MVMRRHELVVLQHAVIVFVELEQRVGSVVHLAHGNDAIAIGVERTQECMIHRVAMRVVMHFAGAAAAGAMRAAGRAAGAAGSAFCRRRGLAACKAVDQEGEGQTQDEDAFFSYRIFWLILGLAVRGTHGETRRGLWSHDARLRLAAVCRVKEC